AKHAAQPVRAEVRDHATRGQVDTDGAAACSYEAGRAPRSEVDRRGHQAVAGEMEMRHAFEPDRVQLVGRKRWRHAAVARPRPLTALPEERAADPVPPKPARAVALNAEPGELAGRERSGRVVAALAHEAGLSAQRGGPRRDVGGLPAGSRSGLRGGVRAGL